ncbi:MAG: hypothetical protein ACI9WC_001236 [Arenicella sp.]|jgi:hypothetical protein
MPFTTKAAIFASASDIDQVILGRLNDPRFHALDYTKTAQLILSFVAGNARFYVVLAAE